LRAEIEMRRLVMKRHLAFVAAVGICLAWSSISYAQVFGTRVEATSCASAIGGNVTASNVSVVCGIPPEVLDAVVKSRTLLLEELVSSHRETISLLKGNLDLNERQIRAALDAVGENNIPPERLADKLVEIAQRFKALQATASAQPGDSPKVIALKGDAQKAIEAGELAKASELFADVVTEETHSLDRLAVNAADTYSRLGEIALIRLRYLEAAKHFANAAAVFPPGSAHEDERIDYLIREARALRQQGDEFGDNAALLSAIERYKRLLQLRSRERVPLDWASTQNDLGIALRALGERESDTTRLEEAVAAYRESLKQRTRERAPLEWAATQNNLGNALHVLGARERGTAKLEESVAAYREALKERTREHLPLQWAMTQNNLGNALRAFGTRERGTTKLKQAVSAYREALQEATRERAPLQWARTQDNLGHALFDLGRRERGTASLEEAVVAYREALKEWTHARVPPYWARTQHHLGDALRVLGQRENDTAKLEDAVAAYREALKERTRERAPLEWATSFGGEGVALLLLADRREDAAMAGTALSQINAALETTRDGGDAPNAAYYERQFSRARAVVGRLRAQ
jgi:tetratricopeptide (TPR) repeat protein